MRFRFSPRVHRLLRLVILGVGVGFPLLTLLCNLWLLLTARGRTFSDLDAIPKRKVALLLGTSKILKNGRLNLYYKYRIEAAIRLYQAGKYETIILSGSGEDPKAHEPQQMAEDLQKAGLPETALRLDPKGLRTILSAIECKTTLACSSVLLISQAFHNPRALYLFRSLGIEAIAFDAEGVPFLYDPKTPIREIFARLWAFFEGFLVKKHA